MTTWAQVVNDTAHDVIVGENLADLIAEGFQPHGVEWSVIPDGVKGGATLADGVWTNPPDIPASPKALSKTEFNKFGWQQIGMARFQAILESVRKSTGTEDADYEARAAVEQYDSAQTFAKSEVVAIGAFIKAVNLMTDDEYSAMTGDDWPTE
jgi:hypothetical protein